MKNRSIGIHSENSTPLLENNQLGFQKHFHPSYPKHINSKQNLEPVIYVSYPRSNPITCSTVKSQSQSELEQIHRCNIKRNLESRLESAKLQHDKRLIRLLKDELVSFQCYDTVCV